MWRVKCCWCSPNHCHCHCHKLFICASKWHKVSSVPWCCALFPHFLECVWLKKYFTGNSACVQVLAKRFPAQKLTQNKIWDKQNKKRKNEISNLSSAHWINVKDANISKCEERRWMDFSITITSRIAVEWGICLYKVLGSSGFDSKHQLLPTFQRFTHTHNHTHTVTTNSIFAFLSFHFRRCLFFAFREKLCALHHLTLFTSFESEDAWNYGKTKESTKYKWESKIDEEK